MNGTQDVGWSLPILVVLFVSLLLPLTVLAAPETDDQRGFPEYLILLIPGILVLLARALSRCWPQC